MWALHTMYYSLQTQLIRDRFNDDVNSTTLSCILQTCSGLLLFFFTLLSRVRSHKESHGASRSLSFLSASLSCSHVLGGHIMGDFDPSVKNADAAVSMKADISMGLTKAQTKEQSGMNM